MTLFWIYKDIKNKNIFQIIWELIYFIFVFQKITKEAGEKVSKATAPFTAVIKSYGYN